MRVCRFIWKRLCKLFWSRESTLTGIDSHKWESKIEIYRSLSRKRF